MVAVNMSPMASKVIRREACLWVKGPFGLSDNPKKAPKHLKEGIVFKKKKMIL
jgi:hypothetical protein